MDDVTVVPVLPHPLAEGEFSKMLAVERQERFEMAYGQMLGRTGGGREGRRAALLAANVAAQCRQVSQAVPALRLALNHMDEGDVGRVAAGVNVRMALHRTDDVVTKVVERIAPVVEHTIKQTNPESAVDKRHGGM